MAEVSQAEHRLRELRHTIVEARSVPMSASCMVNRAETLSAIDDILAGWQAELDAKAEEASREVGRRTWDVLDQTDIVQEAKTRAAQIEAKARAEQEELLAEADRYVETRLAAFEAELQVTLSRVAVMRDRLMTRANKEQSGEETTVIPKWNF